MCKHTHICNFTYVESTVFIWGKAKWFKRKKLDSNPSSAILLFDLEQHAYPKTHLNPSSIKKKMANCKFIFPSPQSSLWPWYWRFSLASLLNYSFHVIVLNYKYLEHRDHTLLNFEDQHPTTFLCLIQLTNIIYQVLERVCSWICLE